MTLYKITLPASLLCQSFPLFFGNHHKIVSEQENHRVLYNFTTNTLVYENIEDKPQIEEYIKQKQQSTQSRHDQKLFLGHDNELKMERESYNSKMKSNEYHFSKF